MVTYRHRINGHESEQMPGDSGEQGGLVFYSSWGCKELNTTQYLNNNNNRQAEWSPEGLLLTVIRDGLCVIRYVSREDVLRRGGEQGSPTLSPGPICPMQTLDSTVIYRLVLLTSLSPAPFYLKKISGRMMWHVDSQFPDRGLNLWPPALEAGRSP